MPFIIISIIIIILLLLEKVNTGKFVLPLSIWVIKLHQTVKITAG